MEISNRPSFVADEPSTLRMASCMAPNADAMCRGMARYLERGLGMKIVLVDDVPWQAREAMLDAGEIDLCWICGLPYARKADANAAIELCVAPVMQAARYGARPVYFSDIVVGSDCGLERFEDLEGQAWAYNEPRSHSGFNIVCHALAERKRTLDFFGSLVQAGSHQAALRMVVSREVAGAAIDSSVLECELRRFPEIGEHIRVIETLGPSAAPPWVMSTRLPARVRARLRSCLSDMAGDPEGAAVLALWNIAELRPIDDAAYDSIRTMEKAAAAAVPSRLSLHASRSGAGQIPAACPHG